jgi:phosphatidylserine/phosphatidylglycerophosphate/cardiolipin synthase-like enzyme
MTSNFTKSALGGASTTNREYGIIDTRSADVTTALGIFTADWNRTSYALTNTDIVLSPVNSRNDFLALINCAKKTLSIEAEEMADPGIITAIIHAKSRGVTVNVILPKGTTDTTGVAQLQARGVLVYRDTQYYMHAKLIVTDGTKAFVGSENISTTSLEKNRELGILICDTTVLSTLKSTFQYDLNNSVSA